MKIKLEKNKDYKLHVVREIQFLIPFATVELTSKDMDNLFSNQKVVTVNISPIDWLICKIYMGFRKIKDIIL